jgi:hypothetical protein
LNTGGEGLAGLRVVEDSKKFLDPEENAEGIELKDEEAPWQRVLDDEVPAPTLPCKIYGTKEEIEAQKELLAEFAAQFSMEVQPTAAEVPALDLDIDLEKWRSLKGNMSSYRTTSAAMAEEIKRQSDTMRKLGVIAVSKADRHSQVLMVKKPHSDPPKYRTMCMDFVSLNSQLHKVSGTLAFASNTRDDTTHRTWEAKIFCQDGPHKRVSPSSDERGVEGVHGIHLLVRPLRMVTCPDGSQRSSIIFPEDNGDRCLSRPALGA